MTTHLRKPCKHGRYDEHAIKDGKFRSRLQAHRHPPAAFTICPGGSEPSVEDLIVELRGHDIEGMVRVEYYGPPGEPFYVEDRS